MNYHSFTPIELVKRLRPFGTNFARLKNKISVLAPLRKKGGMKAEGILCGTQCEKNRGRNNGKGIREKN